MKRLVILGSTGSIGRQTLEVVRAFPKKFRVVGLAGGNNRRLLITQIKEFKPKMVSSLSVIELPPETQLVTMEEMAAAEEADLVVVATTGSAGLLPTLSAIRAGKTVALANKEPLVMAGDILINEARKHRATLRPIDSEHSAIWQCLVGEKSRPVRVTLTASGGPFYQLSASQLSAVTPQQALKHPTWKMGRKVTVDSATLMNKGLEVIEAHWLFGIPLADIQVLIHPQSIVHALVEFPDGSIKAQMAMPDMRLPIQFALTFPERPVNRLLPRLDLTERHTLTFEAPDTKRFPCLELALNAARAGGTYPTVLSAADEVAVDLFLKGHITFTDIPRLVRKVLEQHQSIDQPTLEGILAADSWARQTALRMSKEIHH